MFRRKPRNPFASRLWIDQPDAAKRIDDLTMRGDLSAEESDFLHRFQSDGFARIMLDPQREPLDEVVRDIDRLWKERPSDLLYSFHQPVLHRLSTSEEARDRHPGYRIYGPHSHSPAVRSLYLHQRLHSIAARILGEPVVAIYSHVFEYGSAQQLHRDPVFVPTEVPGHLLAVWIALEDVHPDSGPLRYIPGSHRLPAYEFRPGVFRFDPSLVGEPEMASEQAWLQEQISARKLKPALLDARKGEVLFWHAGLYHGGEPIRDPSRTRRSLVVHYSTRSSYHTAACTFADDQAGGEHRVARTHRVLKEGNALGFANPMSPAGRTSWLPGARNHARALTARFLHS